MFWNRRREEKLPESRRSWAPVSGEVVPLEEVPDTAFSQGAMGMGAAVWMTQGEVLSPLDGVVSYMAPDGHAFSIRSRDGAEVFVHIGLDTVKIGERGFAPRVRQGEEVQAGDLICRVDMNLLEEYECSPITPVVLMESTLWEVSETAKGSVQAGIDWLWKYEEEEETQIRG